MALWHFMQRRAFAGRRPEKKTSRVYLRGPRLLIGSHLCSRALGGFELFGLAYFSASARFQGQKPSRFRNPLALRVRNN